jgi:Pyocin activator protein PrtN
LQTQAAWLQAGHTYHPIKGRSVNSTYFGLLAEFGEANIPLARVSPKYFGLSFEEARRRAPTQMLPCRVFRLGGQKSPWLVSASDLAELIDRRRGQAAKPPEVPRENGVERRPALPAPLVPADSRVADSRNA